MDKPIFCITSDIDWARSSHTKYLIDFFERFGITPTLFATHNCPVVNAFLESHPNDVGIHPNFRVNSTHGKDMVSVIDHMFGLYPNVKVFRSHAFYDSADIWQEMVKRGIRYDSNICLYLQRDIVPLKLSVPGLIRFPVFWEDDDHWANATDWNFYHFKDQFMTPGLKIINVHPSWLWLSFSCPSSEHIHHMKELKTFLENMIRFVQSQGFIFHTLNEIYDMHIRPKAVAFVSCQRPSQNIDLTARISTSVIIGRNVVIGPNCTIGYDGFGFERNVENVPVYIEHKGIVVIGDHVAIQSNTNVDRAEGKDEATTIGSYTKIDSLVHIAHNDHIGERNLIAAGAIFSGEVSVGDDNMFGVNCTIKPSIKIGNRNLIGSGSVVICDIGDDEVWAGNPARKLRDNEFFK
jgi:acetyltransferase-like isoleucine patch superfamily enzyme